MRAFLRAEGETLGFFLGVGLIVAGVAMVSVPGAFLTAGVGACALSYLANRSKR